MNQQIAPPPPPGFEMVGAGTAPRRQPAARQEQARPFTGQLPTDPQAVFGALVMQESGGRAGVLGPQTRYGQAQGRTQMLPETAQEMARRVGVPWRPELMTGTTPEAAAYQDRLGLEYLRQGYEQTGNMRDALRYYHGGPNRDLWGPKTNAYAEEVLNRFAGGDAAPVSQEAPPPPPGFELVDGADIMAPFGNPLEGALDTLTGTDPNEVQITRGLIVDGGKVFTQNREGQRVQLADSEAAWDALSPQEQDARFNAAVAGHSPEYVAEYEAARARSENVPALLENIVQGGTLGAVPLIEGVLGWIDPNVDGVNRGLASQAARDAARDRQATLLRQDPVGTVGAQLAGGLLTPGLKGSGDWITGASGAARTGRAAAVGGAYGGAAGLIGGEGDLGERLPQGLLGAGTGAATGGLLDAGMRRAFAGAERRLTNPSPQRQLSREGVQLTPGQMLEPTPVVGPMIRGIEDGMTGVPLAGAVVQGARNRGIETFNVAAINRALEPIGQRLPRNVKPGYEAVEEAQRRLGQAYDAVLPEITAQLDQPLYDDIARVLEDAAAEMPEDRLAQLARVLQNRVFRNVDQSDATISGEQFKRIESELGALARQYRTANDPAAVSFSEAVVGIQNALREMIGRQNPQQAARLAQINRGYANLVRVEKAAGSTAAQATEGVFSPTQLGVAVAQGSTRSARANEGALLQDLAVAGRSVLPSKVGDSGTATRGAITGLLAGGAALVNPQVAVPTIAVTVGAYSKPAQAALNAIYRATDRQSASSALGELQRFAARNPALQPYYADAVRHVQRVFQSPEQEQGRGARGLLSPTPPAQAVP